MKKYACKNCGFPYEALPPDDIHTKAEVTSCWICKWANKKFWEDVIYECENCDFRNKLYWHFPEEHEFLDHRIARMNFHEKFGSTS